MKKIVTLIAAVALTFGCEDATEIIQPGELLAGNAFANVDDLKTGILAVYNGVNTDNEIAFTAIFTDEAAAGRVGGSGGALHQYNLNETTGIVSTIWVNNYGAILDANVLLNAAENIEPADADEQALYNEAIAEALTIRAYAHSKLLSYFAEDLADNSSLGVINLDFVPAQTTVLPRNTVGETLEFIYDDLQQAEDLFVSAGTTASQTFIDARFVRALRARMALYNRDYPTAVAAANSVLVDYTLPATASEDDYRAIWQDIPGSGENEIIFKLEQTLNTTARPGQIFNTNRSDFEGAVNYEMSRNLFNSVQADFEAFGDIRRPVFIDPTSVISDDYDSELDPRNADVLVVDKYPGDPNLTGLIAGYTNDLKVMRVVEMHFILAEAAANASNYNEVGRQLKIIQDARYTTQTAAPVFTTQQQAFAGILEERKIELFAEGHRYIDIKRIGDLANQGYDRNETDCTLYPSSVCDLPFTDFRVNSLPIPLNETRVNTTIQQNPGY